MGLALAALLSLSAGLASADEVSPPMVESGTAKSNCQRIVAAGYSPYDYVRLAGNWWWWPGYAGPDGARMSKIWGSVDECRADSNTGAEGTKVKASDNSPVTPTPQATISPSSEGGAEAPSGDNGNSGVVQQPVEPEEPEVPENQEPILVSKHQNSNGGGGSAQGQAPTHCEGLGQANPAVHDRTYGGPRVEINGKVFNEHVPQGQNGEDSHIAGVRCAWNTKADPVVVGDPNNPPAVGKGWKVGWSTWKVYHQQRGYEWQSGWGTKPPFRTGPQRFP